MELKTYTGLETVTEELKVEVDLGWNVFLNTDDGWLCAAFGVSTQEALDWQATVVCTIVLATIPQPALSNKPARKAG